MPKSEEMSDPSIVLIMPVYGQRAYARRTLETFNASTPNPIVVIVDDASPPEPGFDKEWWCIDHPGAVTVHIQHLENLGLTAAWNTGFNAVRNISGLGPDTLIVAGNSDLLFPAQWWRAPMAVTEPGSGRWDIVGPLTNAPGNCPDQDVNKWIRSTTKQGRRQADGGLRLVQPITGQDNDVYNSVVCSDLWERYEAETRPAEVNGFCMIGRRAVWRWYAEDWWKGLVFPASILIMPSGRKNPTPHMTGQECWLAAKVKAEGGRMGTCLGSYVAHWRSATRGIRHATPGWFRERS